MRLFFKIILIFLLNINASYSEEHKFLNSEDRREGPLAFSEKRAPNWQAK